ncbi:MAG: type I 3-dehydroquinate dehydratase [Peptostreptococcus sp.]
MPIIGENREEILQAAREVKKHGIDIIEWRSDYYKEVLDYDRLISLLIELREVVKETVIIFTFRTSSEGGNGGVSDKIYEELNIKIAESGLVDIIDIECMSKEKIARKLIEKIHERGTKVIGSSHNFNNTPSTEIIEKKFMKINNFGVDILKIATMSNSEKDSLNMILASKNISDKLFDKAVISICMGNYGMATRLLGSAITFAFMGEGSAPGQISALDLKKIFR